MNRVLVSLAIPFVALLAWTGTLTSGANTGLEVRLKIKGYDPRDLLSGHYMRYSLDFSEINPCIDGNSSNVCVCLEKDNFGLYDLPQQFGACAGISKSCVVYIKGSCSNGSFTAGVERYSIAEHFAPVLATLPPESSVTVSLDRSGTGQVTGMYVQDETLEDYANRVLGEMQVKPVATQ